MLQERLEVLKVMSEVTGRVDLNEFAKIVGLSAGETMEHLRELEKSGHVRKAGSGYGLTQKGKAVLKASVPVAAGAEFEFYFEVGKPSGLSAASPLEFYEIIKRIDTSCLTFHTHRKDFEMWARNTLRNLTFAEALVNIEKADLTGEDLRSAMKNVVESEYSLL